MSDVTHFLQELGLSQYCSAFLDNAIDYQLLPDLNDADLRELGVKALGHRKRILAAAAQLPHAVQEGTDIAIRAQRRQLTLMFADLVDSARLSNTLELEAYRDVIRAYQDVATAAIEASGGYVAKYLGDGILAYFGYPQSHEDDAERAIRAGRTLISKLTQFNTDTAGPQLSVRIGIETGPVVVGDIIGEAAAREHSVVGETPNLAARLQAIAKPNTVVVGPVTQRLVGHVAAFHPLGEHALKGFSAPVSVWGVEGIETASDRLERGHVSELSPLVGRRREIGTLASAFAQMRAGGTPIVHVIGEAGIGKSRLIHEFAQQNGEVATFLSGHCASHGDATAFFPFIDMLRRWFRNAGHSETVGSSAAIDDLAGRGVDPVRHAPYLLRLLEIPYSWIGDIEPDLVGIRTQEALSHFIKGQGRIRPTVLFINDLHWIDERSATMLNSLAASGDRRGVMILVTFRPGYTPPWAEADEVEEIALGPLSAGESVELFRSRAIGASDNDAIANVVDRASGNPLFLEELARHMAIASGQSAEPHGALIPETLAGLLMQRVDRLSPDARQIVETAAVAGRQFEVALVGEDAELALRELTDSGVIVSDATGSAFRFHHALVQEVIYDSLLGTDRSRLHGIVGARLAARYAGRETEVAERLAHHFEAAGDVVAAARYAHMAGNKALDLFALRDAEAWYGKCLTLAASAGDETDDLMLARTIVNQTQVLCWNADFEAMVGLAQRHFPRIEALGEIKEVSQALTWIGEGYMHAARYVEARNTLNRALQSGRAIRDDSCIGYAKGELMWLDTVVGEGPRYDSLPDRSRELETLAARVGDNYLVTLAKYAHWAHAMQLGGVSRALEAARELRLSGEQNNYPPAACWGACLEAYGEALAGNLTEAERSAQSGLDAAACRFDHLMAHLAHGMVLILAGRSKDGLAILETAPWRSEKIGALYFAYAGDALYGRGLASLGRTREALDWLRDGFVWYQQVGNQRALCMITIETARTLIGGRKTSNDSDRRAIHRLRSLLGRTESAADEARDYLDRALSIGKALSMQAACAEALMLQARLAHHENDAAGAQRLLREAQELACDLDHASLMAEIGSEMRRLIVPG